MIELIGPPKRFKPFLVEGGRDGKNIFRVRQLSDGVTRDMVEQLLEQLPVGFQLHAKDWQRGDEGVQEPLEVYALGNIVEIYPPKHRMLTCASLCSWQHIPVVSKMHVDNIAYFYSDAQGQVRSCIHFNPALLGVANWPGSDNETFEVEIDIFVHPRDKGAEPRLKPPRFGKFEVRDLIMLISNGASLTSEHVRKWRELLLYAAATMRACYENHDTPKDDPTRQYYAECWTQIDAAKENDEALARALDSLAETIKWN